MNSSENIKIITTKSGKHLAYREVNGKLFPIKLAVAQKLLAPTASTEVATNNSTKKAKGTTIRDPKQVAGYPICLKRLLAYTPDHRYACELTCREAYVAPADPCHFSNPVYLKFLRRAVAQHILYRLGDAETTQILVAKLSEDRVWCTYNYQGYYLCLEDAEVTRLITYAATQLGWTTSKPLLVPLLAKEGVDSRVREGDGNPGTEMTLPKGTQLTPCQQQQAQHNGKNSPPYQGGAGGGQQTIPIAITQRALSTGGPDQPAVNARELHAWLEVTTRFNDWIRNRITEYGFIENQDYISFTKNLVSGGQTTDYYISLDMGKELSMVERTAKGRIARRYFIACEKALKAALNTAARDDIQIDWKAVKERAQDIKAAFQILGVPAAKLNAAVNAQLQKEMGLELNALLRQLPALPDCSETTVKRLYHYLQAKANAKGFVYDLHQKCIAADLHLCVRTVGRALKHLQAQALIQIHHEYMNPMNLYYIPDKGTQPTPCQQQQARPIGNPSHSHENPSHSHDPSCHSRENGNPDEIELPEIGYFYIVCEEERSIYRIRNWGDYHRAEDAQRELIAALTIERAKGEAARPTVIQVLIDALADIDSYLQQPREFGRYYVELGQEKSLSRIEAQRTTGAQRELTAALELERSKGEAARPTVIDFLIEILADIECRLSGKFRHYDIKGVETSEGRKLYRLRESLEIEKDKEEAERPTVYEVLVGGLTREFRCPTWFAVQEELTTALELENARGEAKRSDLISNLKQALADIDSYLRVPESVRYHIGWDSEARCVRRIKNWDDYYRIGNVEEIKRELTAALAIENAAKYHRFEVIKALTLALGPVGVAVLGVIAIYEGATYAVDKYRDSLLTTIAAEQAAAQAQLDERLKKVAAATGLAIKSLDDFNQLVDDGTLIYNEQANAWEINKESLYAYNKEIEKLEPELKRQQGALDQLLTKQEERGVEAAKKAVQDMLQGKTAYNQEVVARAKLSTDELVKIEEDLTKKVIDLQKSILDERKSTEDEIRSLRRNKMSEAGQQADIELQINEKLKLAQEALAKGDTDAAKAYGEQIKSLAQELKDSDRAIVGLQKGSDIIVAALEKAKAGAEQFRADISQDAQAEQIKIEADISQAQTAVEQLKTQLSELRDKVVTVTIKQNQEKSSVGSNASAVQGFAEGGRLPGYGGGDRIPALLEAGEYVINKDSTQKFSYLLDLLNFKPDTLLKFLPDLPRFEFGGPVVIPLPSIPEFKPLAMATGGTVETINFNWQIGQRQGQVKTLLSQRQEMSQFVEAIHTLKKGL